jgi:hypothetical protein
MAGLGHVTAAQATSQSAVVGPLGTGGEGAGLGVQLLMLPAAIAMSRIFMCASTGDEGSSI